MSRPGLSPPFPLSFSEQSEEDGKRKTKKKVPEGKGEASSSDEDSDSSSSTSESEMTSESEEEQLEPASWRRKTVRALGQSQGVLMGQTQTSVSLPSRTDHDIFFPTQNMPRCSPYPHPYPIFLFQPPSSKRAPATKEISLLDLEDCEFGW